MRKIAKQKEQEGAEIDLTPMLDVVFIMLIFFIVTASFVKEAGIDVNRPEAATAVSKPRATILVAISDKGEILSPKYAPETIAPAVIARESSIPVATPINATPTVAAVVQELPILIATMAQIIQLAA